MLNPTYQVVRPVAAGSRRDLACGVAFAGVAGTDIRGWTIPSAMPVVSTAKHGSTPAPRPEEAVPR